MDQYDEICRQIDEQIAQLRQAREVVVWLKSQRQRSAEIAGKASGRASKNGGHGGPRAAVNPGATWAEAIDSVLAESSHKLAISEIVERLKEQGRKFGEHTRPDATIRATLNRCQETYGWVSDGKRPSKWRKRKESNKS